MSAPFHAEKTFSDPGDHLFAYGTGVPLPPPHILSRNRR